ncbi:hypothetical protein [Microbacterium album]|uniref:Uncharacterized protein n=1 Tax=Microbacterium album TaxID=2053191 RepID=A0A917IDW9_9MICO|nr:hypothetical protein [Microbacterium album]GGH34128.1 hypothetical protein GCM10010921_01590 [Microbacterium album]
MPDPVPAPIRAELDQTPEWWDRQYRELVRERIPRDAASHEGHDLDEISTYDGTTLRRWCVDCGVSIDPYAQHEDSVTRRTAT